LHGLGEDVTWERSNASIDCLCRRHLALAADAVHMVRQCMTTPSGLGGSKPWQYPAPVDAKPRDIRNRTGLCGPRAVARPPWVADAF